MKRIDAIRKRLEFVKMSPHPLIAEDMKLLLEVVEYAQTIVRRFDWSYQRMHDICLHNDMLALRELLLAKLEEEEE